MDLTCTESGKVQAFIPTCQGLWMNEWQDIRALHQIRWPVNLRLQIVLLSVCPAYQTECCSPCCMKSLLWLYWQRRICEKTQGDPLDCIEFELSRVDATPLSELWRLNKKPTDRILTVILTENISSSFIIQWSSKHNLVFWFVLLTKHQSTPKVFRTSALHFL